MEQTAKYGNISTKQTSTALKTCKKTVNPLHSTTTSYDTIVQQMSRTVFVHFPSPNSHYGAELALSLLVATVGPFFSLACVCFTIYIATPMANCTWKSCFVTSPFTTVYSSLSCSYKVESLVVARILG